MPRSLSLENRAPRTVPRLGAMSSVGAARGRAQAEEEKEEEEQELLEKLLPPALAAVLTPGGWLAPEQVRTPVRLFKGNVVSRDQRAFFIDSRVYGSDDGPIEGLPGGDIPCFGDGCPTCAGAEGSFVWSPMTFDRMAPLKDRKYMPTNNVFEDVYAAHIMNKFEEGRGLWAAGGSVLIKGGVFLNNYIVAAGVSDQSGACFKVTKDSPAAFTIVFQDSLFISGPLSKEFFTVYDSGIHVVNSRWVVPTGTTDKFSIAKPKPAFGGNGNPVYMEKTGPLTKFDGDSDNEHFKWALPLAQGATSVGSTITQLADFTDFAWGGANSQNWRGAYIYSTDGFGLENKQPMLVAADRAGPAKDWGTLAISVSGADSIAKYIRAYPPEFLCSDSRRYGIWCGDGIELVHCPGYVKTLSDWYKVSLAPWKA